MLPVCSFGPALMFPVGKKVVPCGGKLNSESDSKLRVRPIWFLEVSKNKDAIATATFQAKS